MAKRIGIIGAGIGGLSAGMILSKKGYDVTIFEKENMIGGRALGLDGDKLNIQEYRKILSKYNMAIAFSEPSLDEIFKKNMLRGYKIDLGFHSIEGGSMSDVGRITIKADSKIEMLGTRLALIKESGGFDYPLVTFLDKLKFLPLILRLYLSGEKTMKELDNMSIADAIKRYGKGKMKLILELLPRVTTTVNDLKNISTGESLRATQSNLRRGSSPVGYPINGLGAVNEVLAKSIKDNNSKIRLNTKIEKIIIKNNRIAGVKTTDKKYDFDIIIYNGFVQDLFKIADEKVFPKDYVNHLKSLKGTGSLCAYYSLKNIPIELMGKSFLFIERATGLDGNDVVGMIEFVTADPSGNLSPKGSYLIQSYVICTPKEAKSKKYLEKLRDILDKNLERVYPSYIKNQNWAIYQTIWHLDGVVKSIKDKKPDIRTPISNLYLVGDCTKAPGIGVNCAVKSATILSDLL